MCEPVNHRYEVEIVVRNTAEQRLIDETLEDLAARGIWVHSLKESNPLTGERIAPLPLSESITRRPVTAGLSHV